MNRDAVGARGARAAGIGLVEEIPHPSTGLPTGTDTRIRTDAIDCTITTASSIARPAGHSPRLPVPIRPRQKQHGCLSPSPVKSVLPAVAGIAIHRRFDLDN